MGKTGEDTSPHSFTPFFLQASLYSFLVFEVSVGYGSQHAPIAMSPECVSGLV